MKPKYKVGDQVKFIRSVAMPGTHPELGKIFKISKVETMTVRGIPYYYYILDGFNYAYLPNASSRHQESQIEIVVPEEIPEEKCQCSIQRLLLQGCGCGVKI